MDNATESMEKLRFLCFYSKKSVSFIRLLKYFIDKYKAKIEADLGESTCVILLEKGQ